MSTKPLRLHRTRFPEAVVYKGDPICAYWFEVDGEVFGVNMNMWDHGPQWEVFHGTTVVTVREDWYRLSDLRREAYEECRGFLVDWRAEEEGR